MKIEVKEGEKAVVALAGLQHLSQLLRRKSKEIPHVRNNC